jgi:hypothetical protein
LLILVLAASVVLLRGEREDEQAIASHQIDARRDLTAAEQGLYTDLRVAFDEIQLLREENGSAPRADLPKKACRPSWSMPAARAAAATNGRCWTRRLPGPQPGPEVAGSLLLILPQTADAQPDLAAPRQRRDGPGRPGQRHADRRRLAADRQPLRRRGYPPTPSLRICPCSAPPAAPWRSWPAPCLPGRRRHWQALRIGITLHPYYSYVSNIVGDKAEVVPLIPAGFNPHAYEPRAETSSASAPGRDGAQRRRP